MFFNFDNNGNIPPGFRFQNFPNLQIYQDFVRPFGLEFNASMQLQPKLDIGQNIDFSMYQKQLALMSQKSVKQDFPINMIHDNNFHPTSDLNSIRNFSKQMGNFNNFNSNSQIAINNDNKQFASNNMEMNFNNSKNKNKTAAKRRLSRASSISSVAQDDNQSLKIECFDDTVTCISTPSKSDANSSFIEDDDKSGLNATMISTKAFDSSYSWPKYSFTFDALDLCLYGYVKNSETKSLGHSISGLKLSLLKFESHGADNNASEMDKDKSSLNETIDENNHKKALYFSIESLLTGSKSNQGYELSNDRINFEVPEDIEIRQTFLPDLTHNGMFCKKTIITKGTRFGPFPGKKIFPNEMKISEDNINMWEIFTDGRLTHFINGKIDSTMSNDDPLATNYWMIHVNCARFAQEQNMIAVQYQGEIFYEVCKDIGQGQELLVWYGDSYLQFLGIPVSLKDMTDEVNEDVVENKDGYTCDRCGKVFAYKYYRDKHLKYTRCVDQGDRKFPCHLCSRSFEKRDRLRIHILHVHEKHRPHKCTVCGKSFSQSSSLNKHMRVHSGERPYKCIYCNKAFTASSILRTHIRQHSGEKPFKCKYCGKAFASHAAHDSHVRRTHFLTKDKEPI